MKINPINFCANFKSPVYVINSNDGSFQRFETTSEAAKKMHTTAGQVSYSTKYETVSHDGFFFKKAHDVEKLDENGKIVPDKEKIIKEAINHSIAVYVFDCAGKGKKYINQNQMMSELNLSKRDYSRVLYKDCPKYKDYLIFYARDIEKPQKDGKIGIDYAKVSKAMHNNKNAIYVINKNGEFKRFESFKEMQQDVGIAWSNFYRNIKIGAPYLGKYFFAKAQDIEIKDDDGIYRPDKKKIKEIIKVVNNEN